MVKRRENFLVDPGPLPQRHNRCQNARLAFFCSSPCDRRRIRSAAALGTPLMSAGRRTTVPFEFEQGSRRQSWFKRAGASWSSDRMSTLVIEIIFPMKETCLLRKQSTAPRCRRQNGSRQRGPAHRRRRCVLRTYGRGDQPRRFPRSFKPCAAKFSTNIARKGRQASGLTLVHSGGRRSEQFCPRADSGKLEMEVTVLDLCSVCIVCGLSVVNVVCVFVVVFVCVWFGLVVQRMSTATCSPNPK